MNTTRRVVATLAGTALAASALATTGPAAFAGKPGGTAPLTIQLQGSTTTGDAHSWWADYDVQAEARTIKSVTCSLDGVALGNCGAISATDKKFTRYSTGMLVDGEVGYVEHTFSVTVTTTKASYTATATTIR